MKQNSTQNRKAFLNCCHTKCTLISRSFFLLLFFICTYSYGQITVSTTTTYSASNLPPGGYNLGITIPNGVTLTIDGSIGAGITLTMNSGSTIMVQAGGHLVVQGGAVITSNTTWGGIVVAGTNNIEQFTTFPDPSTTNSTAAFDGILNSNMASAIIKGSHIRKADIGVNSNDGGIVRISANSTFLDCDKAVRIANYHSVTQPDVNACYIMNSIFQWVNNNIYGFGYAMITCEDVRGVDIGGVTIENINGGGALCNRGNGIEAVNADISISRGGDVFCSETTGLECANFICNSNSTITRNTFRYLSLAINSSSTMSGGGFPGSNNGGKTLGVKYSDFYNNMVGIAIGGAMDCRIYNNTFTSSMSVIAGKFNTSMGRECHGQTEIIDIQSKSSRSTNIYSNSFTYDSYDHSLDRGITHIDFSGTDDWQTFIKKNTFTNTAAHPNVATDLVTGIKINGNNRGTQILCNSFTNMGTDVDLNGSTIFSVQKNEDQTGGFKSAGNSFSSLLLGRKRFDNTGNATINYHYDFSNTQEDPVSSGSSLAAQSLTATGATANSEVSKDCEITCVRFLTAIEPINFLYKNSTFSIIPQPANDEIKIVLNDKSTNYASYSIYDLQGKLVLSNQIDNHDKIIVNTANLGIGMYVIRLVGINNQSISQKLLIQH